ncbi:MAG: hypothetical protein WB680_19780 [Candidatus Acidiferrales bacterium]
MVIRITILALAAVSLLCAGQNQNAPQDKTTEQHCAMMQRGDQAMGFSHENSTHHFLLYKDGGAIEVTANQASDTATRDAIRQHLQHIAKMFSAGNFDVPAFIHGQNPPGTAVMKSHADQIAYRYEEIARGARVRITTTEPEALSAVHAFLRYQITDHQTNDPQKVQ